MRTLLRPGPYFEQQVDLLYQYLPLSQTTALILGAGLVALLYGRVPDIALVGWGTALVLVTFGRVGLARRYQRKGQAGASAERWAVWFLFGSLGAALVWGSTAVLLFPPQNIVYQTMLVFVVGGVAIGSVATLSALTSVAISFLFPALLPLVLRLALEGDTDHFVMAGMGLLFSAVLAGAVRLVNGIVLTSLRLRDQNAVQEARLTRQDEELAVRANRLQAIVEHTVDGIVTVSDDGRIEAFNRAAERAFGYSAAQIVGRPVAELLPPEDAPHWRACWEHCLETCRSPGASCELELRRADGSLFPVEITLSQVVHGERRLTVGIFRDITERKRVERIKAEFISTVSHELRTPLTSIRGALGLVAGGMVGELPQTIRPLIDIAAKNSERLSRLIDDILDIERLDSGVMKFDLCEQPLLPIIEQALQANAGYADTYGVSLRLARGEPAARVRVDADRIEQVLANLISNAIKFSPKGGTVEVTMEARPGRVRTLVCDRGCGISVEFQPRVFQKFAQADASNERANAGTGLGLSIARAIVEQHGGEIGFQSEAGAGTTFWFELPRVVAAPTSA